MEWEATSIDTHPAQALFDGLTPQGIHRFVDERRQEDLHLDFKVIPSGKLTREIRRVFASALSGFANADGGVIVWGIEAKKDQDGVDCATALQPIDNAKKIRSDFESLTGDAVNPRPEGIRHQEILETTGGTAGYVATYVPPSESGPHMAKLGEGRYYKRSGDSFYRMEHFDIEDMFGRRAKPLLSCHVRLEPFRSFKNPEYPQSRARFLCRGLAVVQIRNDGRGVARFPHIELTVREPYQFNLHGIKDYNTGLPEVLIAGGGDYLRHKAFAGGSDSVIHIDSVLDVTAILVDRISSTPQSNADLVIDYRLAAEGFRPIEGQIVFGNVDLAERAKSVRPNAI